MNIRQHIMLDKFSNSMRLAAMPLLILAVMDWIPLFALLLIPFGLFVLPILLWLIPVKCIDLGCAGSMKLTCERISFWQVRETFTCKDCGTVLYESVFDPNIEFTIEIG